MDKEASSKLVAVYLTPTEKASLKQMCEQEGATMRGFIRKLIRDAAAVRSGYTDGNNQAGGRYASAAH